MIPKYFRCGDPTQKCPLSVSREIVKEDDFGKCPCANFNCSDYREPVSFADGISGGRQKLVYGLLAGVIVLILMLFVAGTSDPVPGQIEAFQKRLTAVEDEVKAVEAKSLTASSTKSPLSSAQSFERTTAAFIKRSDDVLSSEDQIAIPVLLNECNELIISAKHLRQSMGVVRQGKGVEVAEAKRLIGSLNELENDVETVQEEILSKSEEHATAFDELLESLRSVKARARKIISPVSRPPSSADEKAKNMFAGSKDVLVKQRAKLEAFKPKPKPAPLPFDETDADIVIVTNVDLAKRLIVPLVVSWAKADSHLHEGRYYVASGSKGKIIISLSDDGFSQLASKKTHLIFADSPPSQIEQSELGSSYVESRSVAEVIALDALTLLVHPDNPTSVLKVGEPLIDELGTGAIGSSVRRKADYYGLRSDRSLAISGEQAALIHPDILSLGLYHQEGGNLRAKRLAVKASSQARALKPSHFTIATEDYLYSYRIVAWSSASPNERALNLVKFITSNEGQAIVEKQGFVDLRLRPDPDPINPLVLTTIGKTLNRENLQAGDVSRLSTNFRFAVNESRLDIKGQADIERLTRYLARNYPTHKVVILGFTDSDGSEASNYVLSVKRAKVVVDELVGSKVDAQAAGLGENLPVDTNNTELGKARNRRAEVWVVKP